MNEIGEQRTVTKIPADIRKTSRVVQGQKLKVAAYCRVSTDDEDQLNSYRAQVDYYTKYISGNEEWEFAGIYADEGITGTMVKKRDQFLKMIKDCEKGKIDMILTKSVSRYARNIVDSISYVRKLKRLGIAIYFEEQHINSLKEDSETYIGIHSIMAQSESENISANVKWGIAKRMENGTFSSNMNMFGYRRNKVTKEVYIVEEEAEVVRTIYRYFLDGMSTHQIKEYLNENNIKTYNGKALWQQRSVLNILQNEKYCGDLMYQKTYTVDCLSKKIKQNNGDKTKYLVYNDHEPIISRDTFHQAQAEFAKRNSKRSVSDNAGSPKGRYSGKYAFSQLLVCAECGGYYKRTTVKKKTGTMHYWRCLNRLEYGNKMCINSVGFEEEALKTAVCRGLSTVLRKREKGFELVKSHLIYVASADEKTDDLFYVDRAISEEEEQIAEMAKLSMTSEKNRENYEKAIAECSQRIFVLRDKRTQLIRQLEFNEAAKKEIARIEEYLTEDRAVVDRFDDCTVRRLITKISLSYEGEITIYLKGGYVIHENYVPDKAPAENN